jgi:hypothetical protein
MESGSIIILNLQDPREKIVGKLLTISPSGITIKGVDVNSFNDWTKQFTQKQPTTIIFPTIVFFPMHRVVSCYLDENMGDVPSFSSQFKGRTKREITKVL